MTGASVGFAIHLLNLTTHQISTLPGSDGLYSPRWSPDGHYIAAMPADSQKLVLFDFATRKWAELYSGYIGYPSWSRDGKYIYFDNPFLGKEAAFLRARISDRKLERLASLKDLGRIASMWTGLAPDDSPLLLRDVSVQEIYALDWQLP